MSWKHLDLERCPAPEGSGPALRRSIHSGLLTRGTEMSTATTQQASLAVIRIYKARQAAVTTFSSTCALFAQNGFWLCVQHTGTRHFDNSAARKRRASSVAMIHHNSQSFSFTPTILQACNTSGFAGYNPKFLPWGTPDPETDHKQTRGGIELT